eukprot:6009664-Amphidinium_carterae.1
MTVYLRRGEVNHSLGPTQTEAQRIPHSPGEAHEQASTCAGSACKWYRSRPWTLRFDNKGANHRWGLWHNTSTANGFTLNAQ